MTPKLAWTALTRRAHALHPNELRKGHHSTHTHKDTQIVLINACIQNHKISNDSGRDA